MWPSTHPRRLAGVSALVNGGSLLGKEALCQGSRWAGAAAAGRPCMIIMCTICSNAEMALGFILSMLRAVSKPAAYGKVQGQAVGSAQHPPSKLEVAGLSRAESPGNISIFSGALSKSSQAELLLFPLTCTASISRTSHTVLPPLEEGAALCCSKSGWWGGQVFSSTG